MILRIRKHLKHKNGQSTAEYAILLGLVVGAVVVMQVYVKRGFQGKVKDATDLVTAQSGTITGLTGSVSNTAQYEPYYLAREQVATSARDSQDKLVTAGGAAVSRTGKTVTQQSVVMYRSENMAD
jgi:Flp pilus assembly pilin Flp